MFRDSSTNKLYFNRILRSYRPGHPARTWTPWPDPDDERPGFWSNGGKSSKEAGFGFSFKLNQKGNP